MAPLNAAAVRERYLGLREAAGPSVTVVVATKYVSLDQLGVLAEAGVEVVGENRAQDLVAKHDRYGDAFRWHFIGHLQSNKVRRAASLFETVHSVDSLDLARRLALVGRESGRALRGLVQVDLAGEQTKFGIDEAGLMPALQALRGEPGLVLEGLMVLPPYLDEPEAVRPFFRRLRALGERAAAAGLLAGHELSMGMSHDFEAAVEEGATMVRVGSAIFGERPRAE